MKQQYRFVGACLSATLLAACGNGFSSSTPTSVTPLLGSQPAYRTGAHPSAVTAHKIYVANFNDNTVTTYKSDGTPTTPTITKGLNDPRGIAVDSLGKIYVANFVDNGTNNNVTSYKPDGTQTTPTITGFCGPTGVAVDKNGKIYVSDVCGGSGTGSVTTYKPDGTPTLPTITDGVAEPQGVAVDKNGKIYVSNNGANGDTWTVTTYNANGQQTLPTITAGLNGNAGISVDATGKIYVANNGPSPGYVSTYRPDGKETTPTIANGYPVGIFSVGPKLYVADLNGNTVTTYNALSGKQITPTISGLSGPFDVTFH